MQGILDVCGKRLLIHMLPHLASRRACANSVIDMSSLKAVTHLDNSFYDDEKSEEEQEKIRKERTDRFWRVIESFSNEDRSLFIKFATGRKRLAQGDSLTVSLYNELEDGRLP